MARPKISGVNPCRVSCYLSNDTYDKLKVYARMTEKDVGTIVRGILDSYVDANNDKFNKAMRISNELIELRNSTI